jgi:hypothetical protein
VKPIRLSKHASEQAVERGATEDEIREAIRHGTREAAKRGRLLCRMNFPYGAAWRGTVYPIKQVAPVIVEEAAEIVVITVYTFYF